MTNASWRVKVMAEMERHPDLFSADEAAAYLHLETPRQLDTLRTKFGLAAYPGVGKGFMYWRDDLNDVARRIAGRAPVSVTGKTPMRMAK